VHPNPNQPRYTFDEESLLELAQSIKEHGIIQPLIATKKGDEYELIAGERRLRAAKIAGLKTVPMIIRTYDEQQKLEIAVIENIQRHNLNPLEEAMAFQRLADDFNLTQEEVAKKMGKSRSAVANTLRLLNLPVEIKRGLVDGKITEGHARAILSVDNPQKQLELYEQILNNRLNVRAVEAKAKTMSSKSTRNESNFYTDLENQLRNKVGSKVKIQGQGKGGKIIIDFYSEEELERIIGRIN
jgi:ParB family chromosome partitioning protein